MAHPQNYFEEINYLAHILEKLSKVINHSDPTAENKKKELFSKYKHRVQELGRYLKINFHWEEVKRNIMTSYQKLMISQDLQSVILKKILSDLEQEFIEKHILEEFEKPSQRPQRRKKSVIKKASTKRDIPEIKPEDRIYTKDSLLEMVKLTSRQRDARSKLQNLVDKINELNPDKIEDRIIQYLKEGKK